MPTELFELKVIVEADGWHDVATLMDSVDRALDPHRHAHATTRRWSVVANRIPTEAGEALLECIADADGEASAGHAASGRLSA